ncbi:Hypothetical predicted protein [Lynx pardinus]|uniref:Uncharacterized protein n=1 Tax=Lynx pardinus TaxID=191816 RepID=A0A485NRU3_LYNPA|nr:Hypothetical predicted protein [Lynx pardinus]
MEEIDEIDVNSSAFSTSSSQKTQKQMWMQGYSTITKPLPTSEATDLVALGHSITVSRPRGCHNQKEDRRNSTN